MTIRAAILALAAAALPAAAAAQMPPLGIVDFYGLRRVTAEQVRDALGLREGDPVPRRADAPAIEARLAAIPGVARAKLDLICCHEGKSILWVGIEEDGAPPPPPVRAPRGAVRLPDEIVRAGEAFDRAAMAAVRRGQAEEDDSRGHSLMRDSAARAVQERFVGMAERHGARLREVLRESGDAGHRALAAQVLAYSADKRTVVPDLLEAMRDSASGVRNAAMRALGLIAGLARRAPELGLRVPAEPFVDMLLSLDWTDRNKAALTLAQLTATPDSALFAALRARALPALVEMARWKSPGHAFYPAVILGHLGGMSDEEIGRAFWSGERERIVRAGVR